MNRPESPSGLKVIFTLVRKDLLVEFRSREMLSSMFVFALIVIIIYNIALEYSPSAKSGIVSGIIWVTLIFTGTLGLSRSMGREMSGGLDGLLLAPVDRSLLFLGKMISNIVFILAASILFLPIFGVMFNENLLKIPLLAVVLLGVIGYAAVGTVLSAMTVQARARELLLPILMFPAIVPLLIPLVRVTGGILADMPLIEMQVWFNSLIVYDIVFITAAYLLFPFVIEE